MYVLRVQPAIIELTHTTLICNTHYYEQKSCSNQNTLLKKQTY